MKRPLIGITCNYYPAQDDRDFSRGRDVNYLQVDYHKYLENAGGIPILLPVLHNKEVLQQTIARIDALFLSGGVDIAPEFYNEEIYNEEWPGEIPRSQFEIDVFKIALQQNKPVFGICRGLQVINVAMGGTLYQDLGKQRNLDNHRVIQGKPVPHHNVILETDSWLHKVIGDTTIRVNSSHHQAIKTVAPGLKITAKSDDGVIEGIESTNSNFVVAVQWHPERMEADHAKILAENLIQVAAEAAN
jgi:putative glutamine amidotransferase